MACKYRYIFPRGFLEPERNDRRTSQYSTPARWISRIVCVWMDISHPSPRCTIVESIGVPSSRKPQRIIRRLSTSLFLIRGFWALFSVTNIIVSNNDCPQCPRFSPSHPRDVLTIFSFFLYRLFTLHPLFSARSVSSFFHTFCFFHARSLFLSFALYVILSPVFSPSTFFSWSSRCSTEFVPDLVHYPYNYIRIYLLPTRTSNLRHCFTRKSPPAILELLMLHPGCSTLLVRYIYLYLYTCIYI